MKRLHPDRFRSRKRAPIRHNVIGAPFQVGEVVRVCSLVDETGLREFLGSSGAIEYFEYSCGCGQSFPRDPMIGVRFANGKVEEFWPEELGKRDVLQNSRRPS